LVVLFPELAATLTTSVTVPFEQGTVAGNPVMPGLLDVKRQLVALVT